MVCELAFDMRYEYGNLLLESTPEFRPHVLYLSTDLDPRIVRTHLKGMQRQALPGSIKQEQCDVIERDYVGQQSGEGVENCVCGALRSDCARNLQERTVSC